MNMENFQFNFTAFQIELIIRILLAAICGFLIGYERKRRYKDAGIRTHLILAMGCAILVIVSKYGFLDSKNMGLNVDASRVASNIATGVGFLGAGVIFVKNGSVRGLTTAAGVWATAAIAAAIGAGLYTIGILSTVLLLLIQILIYKLMPSMEAVEICELVVKAKNDPELVQNIKVELKKDNIFINSMKMKKDKDNLELRINIKVHKEHSFENLLKVLYQFENIIEISTNF